VQVDVLLEASNWAPTHNNTQSWRFVVLGGNSKAQFEQLTIELVEKYTEVCLGNTLRWDWEMYQGGPQKYTEVGLGILLEWA